VSIFSNRFVSLLRGVGRSGRASLLQAGVLEKAFLNKRFERGDPSASAVAPLLSALRIVDDTAKISKKSGASNPSFC